MIELPYAPEELQAHVALASLPGFSFPADISASERHWRRDITEAFVLEGSSIAVPTAPGLGVTVDVGLLRDLGAEFLPAVGLPG